MIDNLNQDLTQIEEFPKHTDYQGNWDTYALEMMNKLKQLPNMSQEMILLIDKLETMIDQINSTSTIINEKEESASTSAESAAESEANAKIYKEAAEAISSTLVEGSINDAITGTVSTWSSQFINSKISNIDNTADANKPVSEPQQIEFNKKVNILDVVNNLTSTYANKPLSAYQGKVLKDLIDNINTILTSDNSTLDSIQELVDYITQNRDTLSTLSISNIAGLGTALDGKAAVGHNHNSEYLAINSKASDSYKLGGIDANKHIKKIGSISEDLNMFFEGGFGKITNLNLHRPSGSDWSQIMFLDSGDDTKAQLIIGHNSNNLWFRGYNTTDGWTEWNKTWTDKDMGESSGLDADLLQGVNGSKYARLDKSNYLGDGALFYNGNKEMLYSNYTNDEISVGYGFSKTLLWNDVFINNNIVWHNGNAAAQLAQISSLAIGNIAILEVSAGVTVNNNANVSGLFLKPIELNPINTTDEIYSTGETVGNTWKNISGVALAGGKAGLFRRVL